MKVLACVAHTTKKDKVIVSVYADKGLKQNDILFLPKKDGTSQQCTVESIMICCGRTEVPPKTNISFTTSGFNPKDILTQKTFDQNTGR